MQLIEQQLDDIRRLPTEALRKLWFTVYTEAPRSTRRSFLLEHVLYGVQAKKFGRLKKSTLNRLHRLADNEIQKIHKKIDISEGAELVRVWNGRRYVVKVLNDGFIYEGQHFKSLSKIATEITGSKWSGPVFFGLKKG